MMTELPYYHVDAFADRPFTGNQAAVMPLTAYLDDAVLQAIAEENNFAETAFYVPDATGAADYELRWFTPALEVRLCGHAVIAPYWASVLGRDRFTAYQASARGGYLGCQLEGDRVWLSGQCFTVVKGMFSLR